MDNLDNSSAFNSTEDTQLINSEEKLENNTQQSNTPKNKPNNNQNKYSINYNTNYNTNYSSEKNKKNGCLIAAIIVVVIFAIIFISILASIASIFKTTANVINNGGYIPNEMYYSEGDYVETLYFEGAISSLNSYYDGYNHQWTLDEIDYIIDDEYNKGLILYLDSPGGGTYESDEMYQKIMKYKQLTGRPVYAYMAKQATSGAVYIAMAADEIYASRMTLTGSIGVIMQNYDLSGLMEKLGISEDNVKSGKNKDMFGLSGSTEEQKAILQSIIDESFDIFVNVVANSRNMTVEDVKAFADGRVLSAYQALDLGLIDHVANYDEFMEEMYLKDSFYGCDFIDAAPEGLSIFDKLLAKTDDLIIESYSEKLYNMFEQKNKTLINYICE